MELRVVSSYNRLYKKVGKMGLSFLYGYSGWAMTLRFPHTRIGTKNNTELYICFGWANIKYRRRDNKKPVLCHHHT